MSKAAFRRMKPNCYHLHPELVNPQIKVPTSDELSQLVNWFPKIHGHQAYAGVLRALLEPCALYDRVIGVSKVLLLDLLPVAMSLGSQDGSELLDRCLSELIDLGWIGAGEGACTGEDALPIDVEPVYYPTITLMRELMKAKRVRESEGSNGLFDPNELERISNPRPDKPRKSRKDHRTWLPSSLLIDDRGVISYNPKALGLPLLTEKLAETLKYQIKGPDHGQVERLVLNAFLETSLEKGQWVWLTLGYLSQTLGDAVRSVRPEKDEHFNTPMLRINQVLTCLRDTAAIQKLTFCLLEEDGHKPIYPVEYEGYSLALASQPELPLE